MSGRKSIHSACAEAGALRGRPGALLLAAAMALFPLHRATAAMTIDGDAQALTVTVSEVTRREVTDEIARRFGFEISGPVLDDAPVNGRFRGDLGDVLGAILTANSFLIVYEGGRPARLLLSDRGQGGEAPVDPTMRSLQPNAGIAPEVPGEGTYDGQVVDPSMQGVPFGGEPQPPEPEL
ncbi:MAG: hypothetical protein KF694_01875 [Mesorhizobium sp.]|nr:hypothetical protein [Mesorhizobium sp.]